MAEQKEMLDGQEVVVDYEEGDAGINVEEEDLSDAPNYSMMMDEIEEGEAHG